MDITIHKNLIQSCINSESDFKRNFKEIINNLDNGDLNNQNQFIEILSQIIITDTLSSSISSSTLSTSISNSIYPKKLYIFLLLAKIFELGSQNINNNILENDKLIDKVRCELITLWEEYKVYYIHKKANLQNDKIFKYYHLRALLEFFSYLNKYYGRQWSIIQETINMLNNKGIKIPKTFMIIEKDVEKIDITQNVEIDFTIENKSNNEQCDDEGQLSRTKNDFSKGKFMSSSTASPKNLLKELSNSNLIGKGPILSQLEDDNLSIKSKASNSGVRKNSLGTGFRDIEIDRGKELIIFDSNTSKDIENGSQKLSKFNGYKSNTQGNERLSMKKLSSPEFRKAESDDSQHYSQTSVIIDQDKEDNKKLIFKEHSRNKSQELSSLELNQLRIGSYKNKENSLSHIPKSQCDINDIEKYKVDNRSRINSDASHRDITPKKIAKDLDEIERTISRGRSANKRIDVLQIKEDIQRSFQISGKRTPNLNTDYTHLDIIDLNEKLEKQLKEIRKQNEAYKQEIDHLRRRNEQSTIDDLVNQLEQTQIQISKINQDMQKLKMENLKKTQECENLKIENQTLRQQIDMLNKDNLKIENYTHEINTLKTNYQILQREYQALSQSQSATSNSTMISRENNELKQKLKELQEKNIALQGSMNDIKCQNQGLIKKIYELEELQSSIINQSMQTNNNNIYNIEVNKSQQSNRLSYQPNQLSQQKKLIFDGNSMNNNNNNNNKPINNNEINKSQPIKISDLSLDNLEFHSVKSNCILPSSIGGTYREQDTIGSLNLNIDDIINRTKKNNNNDNEPNSTKSYQNFNTKSMTKKPNTTYEIHIISPQPQTQLKDSQALNELPIQSEEIVSKAQNEYDIGWHSTSSFNLSHTNFNYQSLFGSKVNSKLEDTSNLDFLVGTNRPASNNDPIQGCIVHDKYIVLDEIQNRLKCAPYFHIELNEFKINCLKSKTLLYKNDSFQIGMTSNLFFNDIIGQNNIKLALYYGNMGYESIDNLNTKVSDIDNNILVEVDNIADTTIISTKQTKQVFTFSFDNIPFGPPSLIGSYTYQNNLINFGIIFPIAITKFMDFKPTNSDEFRNKWNLRKQIMLRSEDIQLNKDIIVNTYDFKKYFNGLIDLKPKNEYDYIQGKKSIKFAGIFELDIPKFEYLMKIIFFPNNKVIFQIAYFENNIELAKFIVKTLEFLFGK